MENNQLKWYHGLLALALFAGVLVMENLGLLGRNIWVTLVGEVLFALVAVGVVVIARVPLGDVFRFKRVEILPLIGTYLMWRGLISIAILLTEVMLRFFPSLMDDGDNLAEVMRQMPFLLAVFLIALAPAVCEEMLFRGTVLRSLDKLKIPWLIIVLDGLIFAAAHLSVIKMFPVGILGILLAYLVYSEGNMFYSMFIHFINNSWSVLLTYALFSLTQDTGTQAAGGAAESVVSSGIPLGAIGATLCGCTLSPLLIYIGNHLFRNRKTASGQRVAMKKQWLLLSGAIGLLIFACGTLLFALGFDELIAISGGITGK